MDQVKHLELARLRIVVDVTMLSVDVKEEHSEAPESVDSQMGAVKFILVAHDLLEDICSASLIKEVLALTTHGPVVLLSQEVEKDFLLVIGDTLTHHRLEKGLDVVERKVALLRISDDEFDETHEDVDVLFVGDVVPCKLQLLFPASLFDRCLTD